MGFYWIGFTFWSLIGSSMLLLIWGLWKKSWKALLISGILFILPTLYFLVAAENWFRLLGFSPLIPLFLAYYIRK